MTDTRIVTTHYRYKPPPRKRKAVAAGCTGDRAAEAEASGAARCRAEPPGDRAKGEAPQRQPPGSPESAYSDKPQPIDLPAPLPTDGKKSAIVTARKPGKRYADVPDMTPEEHQRRGDAADRALARAGAPG